MNLHEFQAKEVFRKHGIPVSDSIATVLWKSLQLTGVDPRRLRGWGRIFDGVRA